MHATLRLITAALVFMPIATLAQTAAGQDRIERFESAPSLVLGLSSRQVDSLKSEFDDHLRALDAFGEARRADRSSLSQKRPRSWTLYGRVGALHFQNQIGPEQGAGSKFGLKRTRPALTGKIYVGIHHRW